MCAIGNTTELSGVARRFSVMTADRMPITLASMYCIPDPYPLDPVPASARFPRRPGFRAVRSGWSPFPRPAVPAPCISGYTRKHRTE